MAAKLTLDDIADLRAYEREREDFRARVIALKRRRRLQVGPVITLVFENRDTVRFQIQEMARAERMLTDEAIQGELDTYNPLIPGRGELSATLFIELTSEGELREWLPKLVGIERAVDLVVEDGPEPVIIRAQPEEGHAAQLTRDEITASVHYIRWSLTPDEVARVQGGSVAIVVDHPNYPHRASVTDGTRSELLDDLCGVG